MFFVVHYHLLYRYPYQVHRSKYNQILIEVVQWLCQGGVKDLANKTALVINRIEGFDSRLITQDEILFPYVDIFSQLTTCAGYISIVSLNNVIHWHLYSYCYISNSALS